MENNVHSGGSFCFAGVHILNAPYQIDKEYDYFVPAQMREHISVGSVVIVPFGGGNRNVPAVVSSLKESSVFEKAKPIIGLTPGNLCIGSELYGICEFMRDRCFCSIGEAAKTVLPSGFSVRTSVYYEATDKQYDGEISSAAAEIVAYIAKKGKAYEAELKTKFGKSVQSLRTLVSKGYIFRKTEASCKINTKSDRYMRLLLSEDELSHLREMRKSNFTPKQMTALAELEKNPFTPISELMELSGVGETVLRELVKKGAAEIVPIPKDRNPYADAQKMPPMDFELSESQKKAFDALVGLYRDKEPKAALLHGVTGSGKTNVMQKLVDECIKDGKSAIVLVPEIALTAQAVGIFVGRYGDSVAVLHSGLSAGERLDAWRKINEGRASVVLGTRSAVFAPVKNLGLIVIDEEQESSFKSDMTPKYHARDIARYRCANNSALMLLCSATPSIESYYKARQGIYTLVELCERYGSAKLPDTCILDMRDDDGSYEMPKGDDGKKKITQKILGTRLLSEIKSNLDKGEQSVLFINRRGYQSFISCKKCGFVLECPNCSVSMTYHKYGFSDGGKMMCHYCGYTLDVPKKCPVCESEHISALGTGTQMLEEQLSMYFPDAKILRMDTDTTSGKFSHDTILDAFRRGEADILLGTQMVTKGHDFPNVSLVGVVNADASLHLPDFRANEKTFSLLTQVIGRAGRGEIPGRALVQTYSPDHEVLILSKSQNYKRFYESEIQLRKAAKYPPFCDIALVSFVSETDTEVRLAVKAFGTSLDKALRERYPDVKMIVFGPFEAGIYKVAGRYRMRYVLKCRNNTRTRELLSELYADFLSKTVGDVSMSVDMNPQNL